MTQGRLIIEGDLVADFIFDDPIEPGIEPGAGENTTPSRASSGGTQNESRSPITEANDHPLTHRPEHRTRG